MKKRNFFIVRKKIYKAEPNGTTQEVKEEQQVIPVLPEQKQEETKQTPNNQPGNQNSVNISPTNPNAFVTNFNTPTTNPEEKTEEKEEIKANTTNSMKMTQQELRNWVVFNSL